MMRLVMVRMEVASVPSDVVETQLADSTASRLTLSAVSPNVLSPRAIRPLEASPGRLCYAATVLVGENIHNHRLAWRHTRLLHCTRLWTVRDVRVLFALTGMTYRGFS